MTPFRSLVSTLRPPAAAAPSQYLALSSAARVALDINKWRTLSVGIFLLPVLGFGALGAAWVTVPVVAMLLGWCALTLLWAYLLGRTRDTRSVTSLAVLISMTDLTLVTVTLGLAEGAWWFGPSMHLIVIAACAMTLQLFPMMAVTAYGALCYAALIFGEAAGWWQPASNPDSPTVVGKWGSSVEIVVLAWLAMFTTVLLLWGFHERLQRVYRRFRQLFNASPYVIFTVRPDGGVTSANPAARQYGVPESAVAPASVMLDRMPEEDRARVLALIDAAFAGAPGQLEQSIRRGDGSERWLRLTFTPTGTSDQQRVLVMGADITDERLAAQERERLEREIESASRMRLVGQLVSGVAHELNNPLAAILNYGELLRAETRPPQDAEALEVIHAQAMRARAIVRDLLHVARASGDRVREVASVDTIVRRALQPLAARAAESAVHLQVDMLGEVRPQRVDVPGIEQVVTNLVTNAIDAAPGGTVRLLVQAEGDATRIEVSDTGAGIAPAAMAHLFEPFFTTKSQGNGTGLGLAVSRGIVEQHGGTITAENGASGSGIGARFVVRLPATPSHAEPVPTVRAAPPETVPPPTPGRIRVALLIDDEEAVRAPMARALRNNGWGVLESGDGQAALELLRSPEGRTVELIVSDIKMPRMDGPTFYHQLVVERPALAHRVLFATGDTASDEVAHFLAASSCPVIEKPFTLRALIEQVTRVAATDAPVTA
jgi:PAS domain S-box-containing protein